MVSAKILKKTSFFRIFTRNTIVFVVKCRVFLRKSSRTTRFSMFTARFRAKHIISDDNGEFFPLMAAGSPPLIVCARFCLDFS